MKSINLFLAVLAGVLFSGYDLWLIWNGLFHPATILPLVVWVGFIVWCCRARRPLASASS